MAAQGERELGDIVMGEGLLDPMAQDIPEQDIVMVEEELPPQMDPEPEMGMAAAAFDPPPPLHQNPSPAPDGSTPDNGELTAAGLADVRGMFDALMGAMRANAQETKEIKNNMEANTNEMKKETKGMREEMKEMRGEMQNMGVGLQDGLEKLKIGNGELRRATCWARREKVTETVTRTLKVEETTNTRETRRQVTELTETREMVTVVERLHGVNEKGDAHTHTHIEVARDNGGELAERVGTRCEQLVVLPREQGEGVFPLEAGHDQGNSVVPREVEGVSAADGCTRSLGGVKTPGARVEASFRV